MDKMKEILRMKRIFFLIQVQSYENFSKFAHEISINLN